MKFTYFTKYVAHHSPLTITYTSQRGWPKFLLRDVSNRSVSIVIHSTCRSLNPSDEAATYKQHRSDIKAIYTHTYHIHGSFQDQFFGENG